MPSADRLSPSSTNARRIPAKEEGQRGAKGQHAGGNNDHDGGFSEGVFVPSGDVIHSLSFSLSLSRVPHHHFIAAVVQVRLSLSLSLPCRVCMMHDTLQCRNRTRETPNALSSNGRLRD